MASHYQTTATIPSELLDVVRQARELLAAMDKFGDPLQFAAWRRGLGSALAKLDALS